MPINYEPDQAPNTLGRVGFCAKVGLEAVRGVNTINEIAQNYGVHPVQVSQWKRAIQDYNEFRPHESLGDVARWSSCIGNLLRKSLVLNCPLDRLVYVLPTYPNYYAVPVVMLSLFPVGSVNLFLLCTLLCLVASWSVSLQTEPFKKGLRNRVRGVSLR
jgi:hypothetical protein